MVPALSAEIFHSVFPETLGVTLAVTSAPVATVPSFVLAVLSRLASDLLATFVSRSAPTVALFAGLVAPVMDAKSEDVAVAACPAIAAAVPSDVITAASVTAVTPSARWS